MNSEKYAVKKI